MQEKDLFEWAFIGVLTSVTAFLIVFTLTPIWIKFLEKMNWVVDDRHRRGGAKVSRPGGPILLAGILGAEIILYTFLGTTEILAVIFTTTLAFVVGIIDDLKVMSGWFKPLALAASSIPIIILGTYDTSIAFPLFGNLEISWLYLAVIPLMISLLGNTLNSIDVMNGLSSIFMVIASIVLIIGLIIVENYEMVFVTLPLLFVSIAFYRYHKFPARIFPGDSGALVFGAMYGTLAIAGNVEIIAIIALLPAIINSFLFLSSTRRIVEHRQIGGRPTEMTDDFKIKSTQSVKAAISLVRLLVAKKPLTEKEIVSQVVKLTLVSGILSIITALMINSEISIIGNIGV